MVGNDCDVELTGARLQLTMTNTMTATKAVRPKIRMNTMLGNVPHGAT